MTSPALREVLRFENKLLLRAAGMAFFLEALALLLIGLMQGNWIFHKASTNSDDFVEAQVMELPKEAHLTSQAPALVKAPPEAAISKVAGEGKKTKTDQAKLDEQNQTKAGPKSTAPVLGPTHGPVALYAPAPVIPGYLSEKEVNTSVVIEFFITAQGAVTPRLLSSSNNEELDALALKTVAKWQFRPAEKDHQAIDSKIRLRIVFQVY